ncbi:MAG: 1-phosphofructokinase, partial [uncultured Solirubrobacteraceae bacterium]
DHHRHAQHRGRQDPGGAQLPAGAPPSQRRSDDHARRQGRQRRPRPQGTGSAGDRHRAGGRPDRDAHRRAAHRDVGAQRFRPHPGGLPHQHRGHRPDHRRADRDQRARPPRLRA